MIKVLLIEDSSLVNSIILLLFLGFLVGLILYYLFRMIEVTYVLKHRKPLYNHVYLFLKKIDTNKKSILRNQFSFYNKLSDKEKRFFEHRLVCFIEDKDFIGREGVIINDEVKVLISATAVMLTFGFRDFYIGLISKIVVYPTKFYSNTNEAYHKGEFNPRLETLVVSWKDFKEGYSIDYDNINLGIHEITHAIHFNSIKERDISSTIFSDSFKELSDMLTQDETLRTNLLTSNYFRRYAFSNQFEFLAVIIENFIETPKDFKNHFPQIYFKVKQMLNFNVADY
ncbi:zinc-dependent peptidase [Siansivirga zeaxanthinifaciens]|uniref:DgsA anti-repressor MtfA n=1 Tax=Siansivirga zeaxanthinifaciens CC-SAMT-1 TaxID=1454006 RepID=A0A0C5W8T7_9FLAO|nr:zinc-dependent peptidase [Siansivirga zeaxanthinifaciens]AJR03583.1 hypothetical protein AW14_08095 [Siansivirga zeaxanthinifaciens CC-SAMT-1]